MLVPQRSVTGERESPAVANAIDRYRGFISYRRDDTRHIVGRIYEVFRRDLPDDLMFHDVDSIGPGVPFSAAIERAISGAAVALVVIGPAWLDTTGADGRRRLDNPDDHVRLEIETALRHGVKLLPVLVDDARMPGEHELPAGLAELPGSNAVRLRSDAFDRDVANLVQDVDGLVAASFPERRPASGETFHVTDPDLGNYRPGAAVGVFIATLLWIYGVTTENVWLRLGGSMLLGAAVIPVFLAYYSRDDGLAVNPGGIEVRQTGLTHRFSWREIDRIDVAASETSVFLVSRTVSDRLKEEYAGRRTWPRWDARAGHLVICDLKAEVRRGSGQHSVTVTADRYSGGSEYLVFRAVTRYRPRSGYDGLPNPAGSSPAPRIRLALPLAVAALVAAVGIVFAVATGKPADPAPSAGVTNERLAKEPEYSSARPGCDAGSVKFQWQTVGGSVDCQSRTRVRKSRTWNGNIAENNAELRLRHVDQPFPSSYRITVNLLRASDPDPTAVAACAGFATHTNADGTTLEELAVCPSDSGAKYSLIKIANGREIHRDEGVVRNALPLTLTADVTSSAVAFTVRNAAGEMGRLNASAVSSTTAYVGLTVFWMSAGATAEFGDFSYRAA
jgi:hypothetical protein